MNMTAGRGVAVPSFRLSPPEPSLASSRGSLAKESRQEVDIPESTVTPAARHTSKSSIDPNSHPDPLWKSLPPPPRWPAWEDRASSISSRQRQIAESERIKPPPVSGPAFTGFERFGWLATVILIVGLVAVCVATALLLFLWLAPWSNQVWLRVANKNMMKTAVTLSSMVIRSAASWHASVATAMLAAIALEKIQVPVLQLASISTMRNINSGPYYFTWLMLDAVRRQAKWTKFLLVALATALSINTALLQLTSTVLVLDLENAAVPGLPWQGNRTTGYKYGTSSKEAHHIGGSAWHMKASSYPTFAEYAVSPPPKEDGVLDTGLTMRSYLPMANQTVRESLKTYSGDAVVIDMRVKCHRPTLGSNTSINITAGVFIVSGSIRPESWTNSSEPGFLTGPDTFQDFSCSLPVTSTRAPEYQTQWRIVLCPLSYPKITLQSQFARGGYGSEAPVYVVLNLTTGWAEAVDFPDTSTHGSNMLPSSGAGRQAIGDVLLDPSAQPRISSRNEWLDLIWDKRYNHAADGRYTSEQTLANSHLQISVSQCFSAYEAVNMPVEVSRKRPRREPRAAYETNAKSGDQDAGRYHYDEVRMYLGQDISLSSDRRGILDLPPRSNWMPWEAINQGRARDMFDVSSAGLDNQGSLLSTSSLSAFAEVYYYADWDVLASNHTQLLFVDLSLASLFQDILRTNGSLAFAIQSIQTVLAGLNYYDTVEHFDYSTNVTQVTFVNLLVPIRRRGIIALTCVMIIHLVLIAVICTLFTRITTVSALGNAWQTLAQVRAPGPVNEILHHSALKTDTEIEEMVQPGFRRSYDSGIRRNPELKHETICIMSSLSHRNSASSITTSASASASSLTKCGSAYEPRSSSETLMKRRMTSIV